MSRAVFLDRDGTIIEHVPFLSDLEQVVLTPGADAALLELMNSGYLLFLLSNQSGVGRGLFSESQAHACNRRMLELLKLPDSGFQETCMAFEVPGEESLYRKPSPRFILEMIDKYDLRESQCCMVGDSHSDVETGLGAGIRPVLIGTGSSEGVASFENLPAFVTSLRVPHTSDP